VLCCALQDNSTYRTARLSYNLDLNTQLESLQLFVKAEAGAMTNVDAAAPW
jgi:hypothetical protein